MVVLFVGLGRPVAVSSVPQALVMANISVNALIQGVFIFMMMLRRVRSISRIRASSPIDLMT